MKESMRCQHAKMGEEEIKASWKWQDMEIISRFPALFPPLSALSAGPIESLIISSKETEMKGQMMDRQIGKYTDGYIYIYV